MSKINDNDLKALDVCGWQRITRTINIGKQIERYYENDLHGKTGYQEVEVDNHGRIVRLLKDVPPIAGKKYSPDAGSPFTRVH